MILESIIEQIIDHYESNEEAFVNDLAEIMESQPALLAYLSQESIDILLEEEKDILWYIILIICKSVEKSEQKIDISDVELSENEELNWEQYQNQPKGTFREKITIFFEGYHQEDLLAFIEDTLELDDSSPMTAVGREVIFISAKSIIDTLLPTK